MTTKVSRPIAVDLFAGAGGLSLGFEQAGFDVVAAVEIDPIHCATHLYNFPSTSVLCASVADVTGEQIRKAANLDIQTEIDAVVGGAPCQGFSLIGKRSFDDPRNTLVMHFIRIVKELNPKYFVFENVKGLTVGKHKKFLEEIVNELSNTGYKITLPYKVLNAKDYGVPQSRERLFLVGSRADQNQFNYPEATQPSVTVKDAIFDLPNANKYKTLVNSDSVKTNWVSVSRYSKVLRGIQQDPHDYSHPRSWDKSLLTSSTRTEHSPASVKRFKETKNGAVEPISRFLKLDPNGVCNTLRAGTDSSRGAFTSPRPINPFFNRVLTVREAARLHSYPDWFRFHRTKWHGFRQVGNSVPPLLARAIGNSVMKALEITPTRPHVPINVGEARLLALDMAKAAEMFSVDRKVIAQRERKNV